MKNKMNSLFIKIRQDQISWICIWLCIISLCASFFFSIAYLAGYTPQIRLFQNGGLACILLAMVFVLVILYRIYFSDK